MPFSDRREAGRRLGEAMRDLAADEPVVLGLPRGGVPVAYEVARVLDAALDVLVVRKLGCPWQPELGLGAVGEGGVRVLNADVIRRTQASAVELESVTSRESSELERRVARYRQGRPGIDLSGRTVLVIDDGLATGFTAKAGIEVVRRRGAARVVLGVPVAPADALAELEDLADEVVCLEAPAWLGVIGELYVDFSPTTDAEVIELLAAGGRSAVVDPAVSDPRRAVDIPVGARSYLPGELVVPDSADGLVVFAHGSGTGRRSPRILAAARALNELNLATLLLDLLTADEATDRATAFDIELLAGRLVGATRWLRREPTVAGLARGYFGAGNGAAAALWAAAEPDTEVAAVVSRGGRPDLAADRLAMVSAPTLFIVGSRATAVRDLNEQARVQLRGPTRLEVVPGGSPHFEEPGSLDTVSALAGSWFIRHLSRATAAG